MLVDGRVTLAPAYVLLASREGSYMSGAIILLLGGMPMY
jgi:hypothetical protein